MSKISYKCHKQNQHCVDLDVSDVTCLFSFILKTFFMIKYLLFFLVPVLIFFHGNVFQFYFYNWEVFTSGLSLQYFKGACKKDGE